MRNTEELLENFYDAAREFGRLSDKGAAPERLSHAASEVFTAARTLDVVELDQSTAEDVRRQAEAVSRAVSGGVPGSLPDWTLEPRIM